jgi:hypothetical protein
LLAGDHEAVAARLGRALNTWPAASGPRRAELWRRLGEARAGRGDTRGAEASWEKAIAADPESDAALGARRALVHAAMRSGRPALEPLAWLVEAEQEPSEVLAYAQCLATATEAGLGQAEDARAMFELATALGAEPGDADDAFFARHPARVMASDESYARALDPAELRAFVTDDDEGPLGDLLEALWEAAGVLCPDPKTALERAGLAAERVAPLSPAAAAALYPQIVKALGGPNTLLYAARGDAPELKLVLASPPVVVLGPALASTRARSRSDADVLADADLRFRLGRVVELARPRRVFAAGVSPLSFARTLWQAFRADAGAGASVEQHVAIEAEQLKIKLPIVLRSRLAEKLRAMSIDALDPMRYLAACERAADRAGLLVCGHVGVAVGLAGGASDGRHVVKAAGSAPYLAMRRRLRGG